MSDIFSPDKFLKHISSKGDLAKSSKFLVELSVFPDMKYVCEAAELPGYNINPIESKVGSLSWYVPSTANMNEIQLTFLCTSNMDEKTNIDVLMRMLTYRDGFSGIYGSTRSQDFAPYAQYLNSAMFDIKIQQFPESGSKRIYPTQQNYWDERYIVQIEEAFPISMQPLPLSWGDTEGIHRLLVSFRYTTWRRVSAIYGELDFVEASQEVVSDGPLPEVEIGRFNEQGDYETAEPNEQFFQQTIRGPL